VAYGLNRGDLWQALFLAIALMLWGSWAWAGGSGTAYGDGSAPFCSSWDSLLPSLPSVASADSTTTEWGLTAHRHESAPGQRHECVSPRCLHCQPVPPSPRSSLPPALVDDWLWGC
jgi:hypothetical protein